MINSTIFTSIRSRARSSAAVRRRWPTAATLGRATTTAPPTKPPTAPANRLEGFSLPTVWSEFTPLAAASGAVNLGQGFPDWQAPGFAKDCIKSAVDDNFNQYSRPWGHMALTESLSKHYGLKFGQMLDPATNIAISNGCSQGLQMAFAATLNPLDEVIILEPAMDIYAAQIQLAGGVRVGVPLRHRPSVDDDDHAKPGALSAADFKIDLNELESKITDRTKVLVLNSPHNPTGKMFTRDEMLALSNIVSKHNLLVFSDEVYEALTLDDHHQHVHFASLPDMWHRTLTFSSSAKTFSVTGWKCGWVIGPADMVANVANVAQWSHFCVNTATQEAVGRMLSLAELPFEGHKNYYEWVRHMYRSKRDHMERMLWAAGLTPIVPQGGFFMLADTTHQKIPSSYLDTPTAACPEMTRDWAFCRWLTELHGVAAIPPSAFYSELDLRPIAANWARFAFCKTDAALSEAEGRLVSFRASSETCASSTAASASRVPSTGMPSPAARARGHTTAARGGSTTTSTRMLNSPVPKRRGRPRKTNLIDPNEPFASATAAAAAAAAPTTTTNNNKSNSNMAKRNVRKAAAVANKTNNAHDHHHHTHQHHHRKAPIATEFQVRAPSPRSPSLNTSGDSGPDGSMSIEGIKVTQSVDGFYSMLSKDLDMRSTYRLLCASVVPRPIAWVSTVSATGVTNLAPMSFFMPVTSNPPTVAWSQTVKADGTEKDTLVNIRATGEFVVNHVSGDLFGKMYQSSKEMDSDIDEFEQCGIARLPSVSVAPPRVADARVQLECKLTNIVPVGSGGYGSSSIVIGQVVRWHIRPHCAVVKVDTDGTRRFDLDADSLGTIGRLGGMEYWQAPYKFCDQDVWSDKYW